MQDSVEQKPAQYQYTKASTENLEQSDTIDAVGVVAVFRSYAVTSRAFRAYFLPFGFFPALFHQITWEGTF